MRSCTFLPNCYLATGGYDSSVKIWDIETGRCLHSMEHSLMKPRFIRFMSNGYMVVGGWMNEIDIYDASIYNVRTHFYNEFYKLGTSTNVIFTFK